MRSIDYSKWANYIFKISNEVKRKNLSVLEIACGTGVLAEHLKSKFKSLISCDLSYYMLQKVKGKAVMKVCCDMTALPFKNEFDFIFCAFDSVNYIQSKDKYKKLFEGVDYCLAKDGVFTFDVSLESNSIKYQRYLNRTGKFEGTKYVQRSFFNQKSRIHYNYFELTLADGSKVEEIHKQKIYPFEDYFTFIGDSNFYVHRCYEAFSTKDANEKAERAQFILKKKKNAFI